MVEEMHTIAERLIKSWIANLPQYPLGEKSVEEITSTVKHTVTHQIKAVNIKTE